MPLQDWDAALSDFLLDVRSRLSDRTARFYRSQLRGLVAWADGEHITLQAFTVRHLRAYLVARQQAGVSESTRRHDAVSAKSFLRFATREGYLDANPLRDYAIPKAATPHVHMPTDEEIRLFLAAVQDRWSPKRNWGTARFAPRERAFLRARDKAVFGVLVDTALRAGEALALELTDVDMHSRTLTVREAKGDEPRRVPFGESLARDLTDYMRVRPSCDSACLFMTRWGDPVTLRCLEQSHHRYLEFAGIPRRFTLHGLRHYAITCLAKTDLWAASVCAGHKDLKVTKSYLHRDPVHIRGAHDAAAPLDRLIVRRKTADRRRKLI